MMGLSLKKKSVCGKASLTFSPKPKSYRKGQEEQEEESQIRGQGLGWLIPFSLLRL